MFTSLSCSAQQTVIWIGCYLALVTWIVLTILIAKHLVKKDWTRSKIALLYLLNSSSFLFAWWMILRTALIVVTPIEDSREHSIDIIWTEANRYRADHVQLAVVALLGFVLFDLLYVRYLLRQRAVRHATILFLANAVVLLSAAYLSADTYYTGMLQEIDRHFVGR